MAERVSETDSSRTRWRDWFEDSYAWSRARRARLFTLVAATQFAVLAVVGGVAAAFGSNEFGFRWAGRSLFVISGFCALLFLPLAWRGLVLERRQSEARGYLIGVSHLYGLLMGGCLYLAGPFSGVTWLTITASSLSVLIGLGTAPALRLLGSLAFALFAATSAGMAGWIPNEPLLELPAGAVVHPLRYAGTLLVHIFAAVASLAQLGFLAIMLRNRERKFRGLSSRDPLTGIANRRIMMERLEESWSRVQRHHEPLAIAVADVDHFKVVNDKFGHPTGDRVLKQVAQVLRTSLRGEDTVGRWGGEEFMILLPLQGLVSAKAALERCRVQIQSAPVESEDGRPVRVTASFGLALLPGDPATTIQELVAAADAALYRAKRNGRNRVEVAPSAQRASA
ncbi:MAG: diguanylate cyclase [Planctomycetota bacterium]|nr:diguanylate cyclase [Planctomycetota bacterium]